MMFFNIFGTGFLLKSWTEDNLTGTLRWIGWASAAGLFAVGGAGVQRALKHDTPRATDVLSRDTRPPIVYLRSFKRDGAPLAHWPHSQLAANPFEQTLTDVFRTRGPVVVIGNPTDSLGHPGPAHLWAGDDWRTAVRDLVARATLIVARADSSDNLTWEIQLALNVAPEKLLLFIGAGVNRPQLEHLIRQETGQPISPINGKNALGVVVWFDKGKHAYAQPVRIVMPKGLTFLKLYSVAVAAAIQDIADRRLEPSTGLD